MNKVKNIQVVEFGRFEMDTWYYAPYPEPYASQHKLYICEYTLKYFRKKKTLIRHLAKLDLRHPPGVFLITPVFCGICRTMSRFLPSLHPHISPGDEIYRSPPPPPGQPNFVGGAVTSPPISVFEVDGKKAKVMYSQVIGRIGMQLLSLCSQPIPSALSFTGLLPEPVSPLKALPGPQDPILRRRPFSVLCHV